MVKSAPHSNSNSNAPASVGSCGTNDKGGEVALFHSSSTSSSSPMTGHNDLPSIDGIEFVDYVDERQLEDVMRLVGQDLSEPYSVFTYRYFLHRWPKLCILAVSTTTTTTNGCGDGDEGKNDNNENIQEEEGWKRKSRRPIGCVVCKIDIEGGDYQDYCDEYVRQGSSDNDACALDGNHNQHNIIDANNEERGGELFAAKQQTRTGYIGMLAVENSHRRSGIGFALVQRAIHRMQQMGCQSIRLETEVSNKAAIALYENRLGFLREELLKKYYLNWGDAYRLRLWLDK